MEKELLTLLLPLLPLALLGKSETFSLKSSAFEDGQRIPERYTCKGEDISPPLSWEAPPKGTKAFALIVDDPDAPGGTFTHWIVWNLPSSLRALPEGVKVKTLDPDIREGKNDFGTLGYRGPCPPRGHGTHRYRFHLYALKEPVPADVPEGIGAAELRRYLTPLILAEVVLTGTFSR